MRKMMFIINPISGGGKALEVWKVVEAELQKKKRSYSFEFTTESITAGKLANQAAKAGYKWIFGIGGDGTFSQIVNGLIEKGKWLYKDLAFSPIPAGRGNDFVKTVKVPKDPKKAILQILDGKEQNIDIIQVDYTKDDTSRATYYCLNLADFGMGGEVVFKVNRSHLGRFIGGKAVFMLYSFLCLFTYRNKKIQLKISKYETWSSKCKLVVCANGQFAGGGMWFAPNAVLDDGLMDLLVIQDVSLWDTLLKFGKLYRGKLSTEAKVISRKVDYLEASSDEDVYIDVDGENTGKLPATFKVVTKRVTIIC